MQPVKGSTGRLDLNSLGNSSHIFTQGNMTRSGSLDDGSQIVATNFVPQGEATYLSAASLVGIT